MLSHHDRTALSQIERSLELSDPELAAILRDGKRHPSPALRTALVVTLDVLAATLLVLGLVVADPGLTLCAMLLTIGAVCAHAGRRRAWMR